MTAVTRPRRLYILSAPSGAGKTSLVKALLAARPGLVVSVSHTTRTPRAHEVDGRDYHFVNAKRFAELVAGGAFLEHARVFDNHYGTGREQVAAQAREPAASVLLEIDWQGARQMRRSVPEVRFDIHPAAIARQRSSSGCAHAAPTAIR